MCSDRIKAWDLPFFMRLRGGGGLNLEYKIQEFTEITYKTMIQIGKQNSIKKDS
jgi:hypothetical protein